MLSKVIVTAEPGTIPVLFVTADLKKKEAKAYSMNAF